MISPVNTPGDPDIVLLSRHEFRDRCFERDDQTCVVPWCSTSADEVHHIIERSLWDDEGYYLENGVSVCNFHHRQAENDLIPPHAFWRWLDVTPITPHGYGAAITKWGEALDAPPWEEHRDYIKYPSSRHLPFSHSRDRDDTEFRAVDSFIDAPLVVTIKLDGGNTSLVKDVDEPVRARNARHAEHASFDLLKQQYWENDLYSLIPPHLQIFGEWLYARHSIHYGCEGCCETRNQAPSLDSYFYIFGVFDTRYNTWLSWPETEMWSEKLGFPTAPIVRESDTVDTPLFDNDHELYAKLVDDAETVVSQGHEGLVVRHTYPFHYSQFSQRVGKYVRKNHVTEGATHWSKREIQPNRVTDQR